MKREEYKELREQKRIASRYYERCEIQREMNTWRGTLKYFWRLLKN